LSRSRSRGEWIGAILDLVRERRWLDGHLLPPMVLREARQSGRFDPATWTDTVPSAFLQVNRISRQDVVLALSERLSGWTLEQREQLPRAHRIERELIDEVLSDVSESCADFRVASTEFSWLVGASIRWLRSRLDASPSRAPYLYRSDPDLPLEAELHADYAQFLETADSPGWVSTEVTHIGGGRVDVLVTFAEVRIPAELKRETIDPSREAVRRYLPQARAYQGADVALALLVILDLARSPDEPIPSIRDSVWVDASRDSNDRPRCVVVLRVPGNRRPPSRLRAGSEV
jgi:hypothetical protein